MRPRIGIYAGAFDPVHAGHIAFGLAAKQVCGLDTVVLIPEETPRHKTHITDITHRHAMLKLAIADNHGLQIARLRSKQFTVQETLSELRRMFQDTELTLLLGSDVAQHLHTWPGIGMLLQEVSLAIGIRHGHASATVTAALDKARAARGASAQYRFVTTAYDHVASSHIRSGTQAPQHPAVATYINAHSLYTEIKIPNHNAHYT